MGFQIVVGIAEKEINHIPTNKMQVSTAWKIASDAVKHRG